MNTANDKEIQQLATTVRVLSAEAVENANSGHPGLPLGAADFAALLWSEYLQFNPSDPAWLNRDRFILSAGHGCMLVYSLLHLFGYDLSLEELRNFRQWQSKTPGHPEFGVTSGVETTTGPLGQGFANGVGMALSAKLMAQQYGEDLFNYRVFAIVSDGDLMEGVTAEAASLAGHLKLDNLVYIYDDNKISLAGPTGVCFTESVPDRFRSYGWFVQEADGHNLAQLRQCMDKAVKETEKPSLICARTTIGFGSPNKAGDFEVHGAPLGAEELALTKRNLGWMHDGMFFVPDNVRSFCRARVESNKENHKAWKSKYSAWSKSNQGKAALLSAQQERVVPTGLKEDMLSALSEKKKDSTRNLSGKAIQIIAKHVPYFIGGSADLEPSTKTLIKSSTEVQAGKFSGRNIRFGVREHAMGAIVNGLAYDRKWFPFASTFLVFSDYMRPTIRLAAISHLQSIFIFTHDSFWVGEDGPTHQPVEHVASLRLIPNLELWRPADGIEVAMSFYAALERKSGPSVLVLTRQDLPPFDRSPGFAADQVLRGGYVVKDADGGQPAKAVLIASGSEVPLALEAAARIAGAGKGIRIVSMPCVERFKAQPPEYRRSVLPEGIPIAVIEAGVTCGWERLAGTNGLLIGIDHFGASAPGAVLADKFGFTAEQVQNKIMAWLK